MCSGQHLLHRFAIALMTLTMSLGAFVDEAAATSPELGPLRCTTDATIAETLDCLESDAPFEVLPESEDHCAISITLTNRCEHALSFYDGECVALEADGELDERCLLAEIPADAELEVPLEAGLDEAGEPFIGEDTTSAFLLADDGDVAHEVNLSLEQSYRLPPGQRSDEGALDCSSSGSPSSPNRLLIILLLGWFGLRAMAAAPRAGARA
ncbi:hypothetical protein FRC96_00860 [Lujinxingia vulgaris]|uniref:Uncharacterized protein n=1 Tax=Lujinxingia vulgaris TaxID=2600176 RepID=A0A5C6XQX9_9DELT|nr:hypothetical protein [Lujinxingia vulgaris]TXD43704.1 hypothetical protein FRC96_00860 [Lujinxingia vulgaris]